MRYGLEPSLNSTREWLLSTHNLLIQRVEPISHPAYPEDIFYKSMTRNQQVYITVLRGLVDIVFDPWLSSASNQALSLPSTPLGSLPPTPTTPASPFPPTVSRPETLYLDKSRLTNFSTDAADLTVLYMFMLLFRQLSFIDLGKDSSTKPLRSMDDADMLQLRQELLDIGPAKMSACFIPTEIGLGASEKQKREFEHRKGKRSDLALHVAKKASDLRKARGTSQTEERNGSTASHSKISEPPEKRLLNISLRWVEANMQPGSTLSVLLHNRMREVMFDLVVSLAYPGKDVTSLAAAANGTFRLPPAATRGMDFAIPIASTKSSTATANPTVITPATNNSLPVGPSSSHKEADVCHSPSRLSAPTTFPASAPATHLSLPRLKIDLYTSTHALTTAEAITDNHQPGMEGILEDARELAEKISKLALIHLNTFLAMYESDGFFASESANIKWVDRKWTGGFGDGK